MDETSPLAVFLKERREALEMNPRQFAEAISAVGGQATTQAVQQWENTTPGQRTTRPSLSNRRAIARVLGCNVDEVESVYRAARDAGDASGEDDAPTAPSSLTRARAILYGRLENEIADAIRAKIPDASEYLSKLITPFGIRRRYDYLSPRLAAYWIVVSSRHISSPLIESFLWKLLWQSRLDADTGVARKYLFILVIASDAPEVIARIQTDFERLRDEVRVFGNTLTLCLAPSPAEAGALVVAHETGA